LSFLGFAEAPDIFPDSDDVDASCDHELSVLFPTLFRVLGGSSIGINPMLRMIIHAEIHIAKGG
jgi:hypothetical protein